MSSKLEDLSDITAVINRYSTAIDTKNWGLMDQVFAQDGEITMEDWRFTAALGVAHIRECIELCSFTHHANTNITVELGGDRAHAVTYVRAWHRGGPQDTLTLECIGQYADEFVRTPSGWRILRRDEQVRAIHGDFSIFAGLEQKRDRLLAESAAHFAARRGSSDPGD